MSRKEVTVSNVSKKHDNPIAELVQLPAGLTAISVSYTHLTLPTN